MGNCIVLNKEEIKIFKADGEVIKYRSPLKVHQLLSKHESHHDGVSDTPSFSKHLPPRDPDNDLISGQNYYLSKSHMPNLVATAKQEGEQEVKRIKIVISKQELKAMLRKGGEAVDLMLPKQMKTINEADSEKNHGGWKPTLERIAEEIF